jgi:hypothetical protein
MEDNLFLLAMDTDKVLAISETKENKAFALRLVNNLNNVFHIHAKTEDYRNVCAIHIKAKAGYKDGYGHRFYVNSEGVFFISNSIGYYAVDTKLNPHIKPLGALYEKYKDCGVTIDNKFCKTTVDDSFLKKERGHGTVKLKILIYRNDVNLNDKLRDIVYILEQDHYDKKF